MLPTNAPERKAVPICTGVLDYFPDALAEVARVSRTGNDQHNPGQPLHWDKSKSADEADALLRHLAERGKRDLDGMRHSAKVSWRSLALLQRELEAEGRHLRFGKRTVLRMADRRGLRQLWKVRCDCGNEYECLTQHLRRGAGCLRCVHKGPRVYRRKRPYEYRYNVLKNRGRHTVLLTYEEFLEFTKITECHYCSETVTWGSPFGKNRTTGSNLDRKDNNRPYEIDNVVVACRRCNYGKNAFFSYEEWLALGTLIRSWRTALVEK